jgi:hypothetical protein
MARRSGPSADTAQSGRCHAPIKSRRRSSVGDGRHSQSRSDPSGRQRQRESARHRPRDNPTGRTAPIQHQPLTERRCRSHVYPARRAPSTGIDGIEEGDWREPDRCFAYASVCTGGSRSQSSFSCGLHVSAAQLVETCSLKNAGLRIDPAASVPPASDSRHCRCRLQNSDDAAWVGPDAPGLMLGGG